MGVKFSNNGHSTLAASISSSDTSLTVASGHGARFPSLSAGDYFYATLIDASNNLEIVKCTARSSDVLTITRGQESTTARAYAIGDRIELRVTAQGIEDATTIANDSITNAMMADDAIDTAQIADDAITAALIADNAVGAAALNVSGNGTSGQSLLSDGDGSMSWGSGGKVLQVKTTSNTTKHSSSASMGSDYSINSSTAGTQMASITMTRMSSTSRILIWGHSSGNATGNAGSGTGLFAGTTRLAMSLSNGYGADTWNGACHVNIASSSVGSGAVTYQFRLLGSRDGSWVYAYKYGADNMGDFYTSLTVMEVEV